MINKISPIRVSQLKNNKISFKGENNNNLHHFNYTTHTDRTRVTADTILANQRTVKSNLEQIAGISYKELQKKQLEKAYSLQDKAIPYVAKGVIAKEQAESELLRATDIINDSKIDEMARYNSKPYFDHVDQNGHFIEFQTSDLTPYLITMTEKTNKDDDKALRKVVFESPFENRPPIIKEIYINYEKLDQSTEQADRKITYGFVDYRAPLEIKHNIIDYSKSVTLDRTIETAKIDYEFQGNNIDCYKNAKTRASEASKKFSADEIYRFSGKDLDLNSYYENYSLFEKYSGYSRHRSLVEENAQERFFFIDRKPVNMQFDYTVTDECSKAKSKLNINF